MKKKKLSREDKIKYILKNPGKTYSHYAKKLGYSSVDGVRQFFKRQSLPNLRNNIQAKRTELDLPKQISKAIKNRRRTIIELADMFDVAPKEIKVAIEELKSNNVIVDNFTDGGLQMARDMVPKEEPFKIDMSKYKEKEIAFGFVADTHIGSKYERLDVLEALYDRFEQYGIKTVYHGGNWIDGEARFNTHDIYVHGIEAQVENFIKKYPKRKGMTTHIISGDDHEGWYVQRDHINIGQKMEDEARRAGRKDLIDLGYMERDIKLVQPKGSATLRVIHAGGGCFDDKAKILTKDKGWVKFSNLTLQDEVATMTKDSNEFQWQKSTNITNEKYQGDMYQFKHRTFDFNVTPNHGLWIRRNRSYLNSLKEKIMPQKGHGQKECNWHRYEAEQIYNEYGRQKFALPTVCENWKGQLTKYIEIPYRKPKKYASTKIHHYGKLKIEDVAELIAWYVTEGYINKNKNCINISQYQKINPKNYEQIKSLAERIGGKYSTNDKNILFYSTELTDWLLNECDAGSRNKYLPQWLKNQPKNILKIVFETMIKGDGWKHNKGFGYKSISKKLRDDVCEIAQKLGYGITINKDSVSIRTIQNTPTINKKPKKYQYNGQIYCCTVPNELIYVMVNGKAFWSHNSSYATSYTSQKYVESLQGGEKPHIVLVGHYHKFDYSYPREVHICQGGALQDQTPFMRKRKLQANVGGCVIWIKQLENGVITSFKVEWLPFYDKKFYEYRW